MFCDYSVSGLDASRQGYALCKTVLSDPKHLIETIYIDDFTWASRDEIEWWRSGRPAKQCKKRLIGASDGLISPTHNSDYADHDVRLGLAALYQGAFARKFAVDCAVLLAVGPCGEDRHSDSPGRSDRDKDGNVVYRPDGRTRHEPCIDPNTQKYRVLMFELFSAKKWSPYQIARHFNDLKVDGWDGWTESGVKKLLVGLDRWGFIWNRTNREGTMRSRTRWSLWRILAPIGNSASTPSSAWCPWNGGWMPAAVFGMSGRTASRPAQSPAGTRFRPRLCSAASWSAKHCGGRGQADAISGKYRQMGCLNGMQHAHGCKLSSSKSVTVIEDSFLNFIRTNLFSEHVVEGVLKKANTCFEQEACKPQVRDGAIEGGGSEADRQHRKYHAFIEEEPDDTLCRSHNCADQGIAGNVPTTSRQGSTTRSCQNRKPPKPLSLDRGKVYVPDLRELLNQEVAMAAEAIRTLTGPIKIRQEEIPGRPGARWIATFSPDLVALLTKGGPRQGLPGRRQSGRGHGRDAAGRSGDRQGSQVRVVGPVFLEMEKKGASVQTIASVHKVSWQYAKEILDFATTGQTSQVEVPAKGGTGQAKPCQVPRTLKRRLPICAT